MKANAVAALMYRAREGLRQAWIQAHIRSVPTDSECRWTIDRLGAHTRRALTSRNRDRMDAHLAECAKCSIVASEAREVGSRIALVLLPLAAGITGATAYAAWLQQHASTGTFSAGAGAARDRLRRHGSRIRNRRSILPSGFRNGRAGSNNRYRAERRHARDRYR
jgi:hypothetical protein